MYFQQPFLSIEVLAIFQDKKTRQNGKRCTKGFKSDCRFGKHGDTEGHSLFCIPIRRVLLQPDKLLNEEGV